MEHLEQLIKVSQHGFLPGRSCLTKLLAYLESVTKHVDSGLPVDTLYLDFAKALDKVPHRRLSSRALILSNISAGTGSVLIQCHP